MKVKGFLKDVGGASRVTKMRKQLIANGSPLPDPKDPIRELADLLHPGKQQFKVTEIREASPTATTYRFSPVNGHVPVFQSGQYVNFYLTVGDSVLTRAYSISSAPYEARLPEPFFEVTIRHNVHYLVPDWFLENVKVGTEITAALPFGQFLYEPLRDSDHIVGIAGGSGITPFASMAKEIAHGKLDIDLTIIYGSVKHTDIVCGDELEEARKAAPDKIHVVHVMSDDDEWDGEKGFVTEEIIRKYSPEGCSYFFCGPPVMFFLVDKIMKEMGVPLKRFRHDATAQPAVKMIPGFPMDQVGKSRRCSRRAGGGRSRKSGDSYRHALQRRRVRILPHTAPLGRHLRIAAQRRTPRDGQGTRMVPRLLGISDQRPEDQDSNHLEPLRLRHLGPDGHDNHL